MKTETKISFCGPVQDATGYGEFSRYFVYALYKAGLDVVVEAINLDPSSLDFGTKGAVCKKLMQKKPVDVNVINMVPTLFRRFKSPTAKNVGFTMWESSRLPDIWVKACNEMDAIFVPCSWNQDVFIKSGVQVPVYVVQPGVDSEDIPKINTKKGGGVFSFYSIFQWTERKNPEGLVKAFLSEFVGCGDVEMVLKTYRHPRHSNNHQFILDEISKIAKSLNLPQHSLPKISIISKFLSAEEIQSVHNNYDCFVLPHRAEGWGMPHMEAMSFGNPVISTRFSGNVDFMNDDNSLLIDCGQTPCTNMDWYVKWFNGSMWWAEPDLSKLASHMRYVYENRQESGQIGMRGRQTIVDCFNNENSVSQFVDAVDKVRNI